MGVGNDYSDFGDFLDDIKHTGKDKKDEFVSKPTTENGESPLPNHLIKKVCGTCKYFYRANIGTTLGGLCAVFVADRAQTKKERDQIDPKTLPPTMLFTCCDLHTFASKARILSYTNKANIPPSARES